jgi:OmpA-like transmembrane domain
VRDINLIKEGKAMNKWVGGLVAASALLLSSGAMAQGYASFAAGQSKHVDSCSGVPVSCDESGSAFKIVGGYNFDGVGLEIGFTDFGKSKASGFGITAEVQVTALNVVGAFKGNFTPDFAGHLRLGLASVKTEGKASNGFSSYSESENKVQPYFGVGLSYAFSNTLALEAGADFTKAELDGGSNNVRAFTLGLRVSF